MRARITALSQLAAVGAIVATLLYWPAGMALALLVTLFGVSFHAIVTFDGALGLPFGLFAWWLLAFAAACVYSACALPWREQALAWRRKK